MSNEQYFDQFGNVIDVVGDYGELAGEVAASVSMYANFYQLSTIGVEAFLQDSVGLALLSNASFWTLDTIYYAGKLAGPVAATFDMLGRLEAIGSAGDPAREFTAQLGDLSASYLAGSATYVVTGAGPWSGVAAATVGTAVDQSDIGRNLALSYDVGRGALQLGQKGVAEGRSQIELGVMGMIARSNAGIDLSGFGLGDINKCFAAGTEITKPDGSVVFIESVRVGDAVAAFDADEASGRGAMFGKRVTRLFENVTDVWIELSIGLTVTPGHEFLTPDGRFETIDAILQSGGAIVLEDGSEANVTGEYVHYSAATAELYEQAESYVVQSAGVNALTPVPKKGWKTYNFEVEGLHTYVAGGVRVHNTSYDFVSEATGERLYPQQVSRYDPDTGTFSQVVVFRPADGNVGAGQSGIMKWVQGADQSPSGSADSAFQLTGNGPAVTLGSGTTANAGTVFSPGNGYTYVVNPNGSVTNIDTGQTTAPPSSSGTSSPATATSPALQPHTQVSGSGLRRCKSIPFAFPGSPPTGCAGLPSPLRGGVGGGGRAVAGRGPPPVPACGRSTLPSRGRGARLPAFLLAVPAPSAPVSSAPSRPHLRLPHPPPSPASPTTTDASGAANGPICVLRQGNLRPQSGSPPP